VSEDLCPLTASTHSGEGGGWDVAGVAAALACLGLLLPLEPLARVSDDRPSEVGRKLCIHHPRVPRQTHVHDGDTRSVQFVDDLLRWDTDRAHEQSMMTSIGSAFRVITQHCKKTIQIYVFQKKKGNALTVIDKSIV
jgi:hypothetical protein